LLFESFYGKHVIWKDFERPKKANLAELQLEGKIMKLTPKNLLGKMKRKLGLSNKPLSTESNEDEIFFSGCTKRQVLEYCAEEGITLEEYLAQIEQANKEWDAMEPGTRPIVMM
jgi:hypothetical protein